MPSDPARTFTFASITIFFVCAAFAIAVIFAVTGAADDNDQDAKDTKIAKSLAAMLSAGLTVISRNQDRINSPDIENKGLDGQTVLAQTREVYQETTGSDPSKIDPDS